MTIKQRIEEAYNSWNIEQLTLLQMEATFLYSDYCESFAELEQWYDKQRASSFIELTKKKKDDNLTDKVIEAKSKLEAEEQFWNYRQARENKNSIKAILDLISSLIIALRVKNKNLDNIQ